MYKDDFDSNVDSFRQTLCWTVVVLIPDASLFRFATTLFDALETSESGRFMQCTTWGALQEHQLRYIFPFPPDPLVSTQYWMQLSPCFALVLSAVELCLRGQAAI
jgi:hypothetical protein